MQRMGLGGEEGVRTNPALASLTPSLRGQSGIQRRAGEPPNPFREIASSEPERR
jgi:hypothetical protein